MDIKVPEVGESIYEATIGQWHKKNGDFVRKDELICELETDKINLEILAEADGILQTAAAEEETVKIGAIIGQITPGEAPADAAPAATSAPPVETAASQEPAPANPAAARLAAESGIDLAQVQGSGRDGRIIRDDVVAAQQAPQAAPAAVSAPTPTPPSAPAPQTGPTVADDPRSRRVRMTPIRRKIAERLLQARQQTAMLTTFNEADLSRVINLRKKFNEHFQEKHGVKLGFMSFFVKAVIEGLKEFPEVNARIDGEDIVYHDYYNVGIAVGAKKGLVVPVLKDVDGLTFAAIEKAIIDYAEKANSGKLQLTDLEGGTFTISNGGVYGSMLSTPILNPPQSAILGMHAIKKRAVVIDDEIQVRPMMYLALSYDHRIIDGQQAVGFLTTVKDNIEAPEEMLLEM